MVLALTIASRPTSRRLLSTLEFISRSMISLFSITSYIVELMGMMRFMLPMQCTLPSSLIAIVEK